MSKLCTPADEIKMLITATRMQLEQEAAQKRYDAKRLLGDVLGRGGWLNDDLPIARFVDAVIDAAILEIAAKDIQNKIQ